MIAAAHFRRGGADGREPMAAPGDIESLAAHYQPKPQHWGKVTSRPPTRLSKADLELVAFRLGCSSESARQAIAMGLV